MKIRQCLLRVQRLTGRHYLRKQLIHALNLRLEMTQVHLHAVMLLIRDLLLVDKNLPELIKLVLWRQIKQREIIMALVIAAGIRKTRHPLRIDQRRADIRELPRRILLALFTPCLALQAPVAADPSQTVIEPRHRHHQLILRRGVHIRAAIAERLLQGTVMIQDNAILNHHAPRNIILQPCRLRAIFSQIDHQRTS